ncbi:MAG: AraC-like DNA-binding protein [Polaribacter sp.]|jgi:AraC-like DNA-binding protein
MRKNLLFVIFFLNSCFLLSQKSENDDFYLKKLYKYTNINNDSILFYAKKLKHSKINCNILRAINFEAKAYYQKEDFILATEKSLDVIKKIKGKKAECYKLNKLTALNRLFWVYKNQNKYQKAFKVALEKKEINESLDKKSDIYSLNILSIYNNLAIIKSVMGYHRESRLILKDVLPQLPKIYDNLTKNNYYPNSDQGDYFLKINQSYTLNLIGESYLEAGIESNLRELDSASMYFKKAFEVAKTFYPAHKDSEAAYQIREVGVLIAKENFKEALNLIQKFHTNSKSLHIEQNVNSLKAICFYELKNSDSAIYYSKKYLAYQKRNKTDKQKSAVIYDLLANQYHKNKQIDSAFKYSELTVLAIKTLNKSKSKVNKSYYLHDFKNVEALNKILISKNKSTKNSFIIYAAILLIMAFFITLFFYRKNKKITIEFDKINDQVQNTQVLEKTTYKLNVALENKILRGINELEKSKDYLDSSFNINVLAKKINTNTTYLSYTINKIKNKSFKQYVTELKIEYLIKKLKIDKNYRKYTIKYLADEIGYTSASAFTRAFKKHKGITPSEFIKSLSEKN